MGTRNWNTPISYLCHLNEIEMFLRADPGTGNETIVELINSASRPDKTMYRRKFNNCLMLSRTSTFSGGVINFLNKRTIMNSATYLTLGGFQCDSGIVL
jgi:hypothetical protein